MKNGHVLLMCFALPTIALPVAAAPKSQPVQTRWEYSSMENAIRTLNGETESGFQVHLPGGRKFFQPVKRGEGRFEVATQVLNRLGAQGWELVELSQYNGSSVWTLKRRR